VCVCVCVCVYLEFRQGIPCIVVANKIDLDLKVTKKSFNFAAKRNLPFYFVSASEGCVCVCVCVCVFVCVNAVHCV
jgi:predicted GTPase